jgi:hypothetical protein
MREFKRDDVAANVGGGIHAAGICGWAKNIATWMRCRNWQATVK